MKNTVLYIHGMGGGEDSRIPGILRQCFEGSGVDVIVRTYSFDPETATSEIASWVSELEPSLVIGESLGACHALRVNGMPHIFVSPSLGGPLWLGSLAWLALIPGVRPLFNRIYRPAAGRRQTIDFRFRTLRKYRPHWRLAMKNTDPVYAFFGSHDRFRRSGVVSVRLWKRFFGNDTYEVLEGTHYMSETHVREVLVPKIEKTLGIR